MKFAPSKNFPLERNVIQIIYCSQLSQMDHSFSCHYTVNEILDKSIGRNLLRGITGALLTDGKFFGQIIEGASSEVNPLYKDILCDKRHHSITLLQRTVTNIRLLPRWPMALVEVDDMSYVGRLSVQSAPSDLRNACLSILKSLRPVLCGC